ncbi:MAG: type II toxin-antitoxin system VapC family toxin [Isosphaeraceae bacterium]
MTPYVLDTDILSLLERGHPRVQQQCGARSPADLAITVITVEEQLSGWYTTLRNARSPDGLALAYQSLADTVQILARFTILPFTTAAISRSQQLISSRLNVRRSDLRIAAIVLEHRGTLVSRITRDFGRVPGLVIEDWSI